MSLLPHEASVLMNYWPFWARPGQIPPHRDWTIWVMQGSRGSGKTRAVSEQIHEFLSTTPGIRALIISTTKQVAMLKAVIGSAGLLQRIQFDQGKFNKSEGYITYENGSMCLIRGCEASLDLDNYDVIWCEDIHLWPNIAAWMKVITMSQQSSSKRTIFTCSSDLPISLCFPEQLEGLVVSNLDTGIDHSKCKVASSYPCFCYDSKVRLPLLNTNELESLRVQQTPPLKKIVVSIDPSVTPNGCETGIIITGICHTGDLFVLGDESLSAEPEEWAKSAVNAYHNYHAETLVYENNQGGNVIASLLQAVDPTIQVQSVRASKSKVYRLLPLMALILNQKFHLAGFFPVLEQQLTEWMGGGKSPDRLDSLAWGVHSLVWTPLL